MLGNNCPKPLVIDSFDSISISKGCGYIKINMKDKIAYDNFGRSVKFNGDTNEERLYNYFLDKDVTLQNLTLM